MTTNDAPPPALSATQQRRSLRGGSIGPSKASSTVETLDCLAFRNFILFRGEQGVGCRVL